MSRVFALSAAVLVAALFATSAFAQPVFVSGGARVQYEKEEKNTNAKALAATHEAFATLQKQLGDRKPKCYIISDNLAAAGAINDEFKKLFAGVPFAGIGTNWNEYLPIDRDTLGQAPEKERGIVITAILGDVDVQIQTVEGLTMKEVSYQQPEAEQRKQWDAQGPLHEGKGTELVKKMTFPTGEGITNVLIVVGTMHTPRQEYVFKGIKDALPAGVKLVGGAGSNFSTLYDNGRTFPSGLVGIRLSGKFQAVVTGSSSRGKPNLGVAVDEHLTELEAQLGGAKPTSLVYFGCAAWKKQLPDQQKALQAKLPEGMGIFGQYCGGEIGVLKDKPEPVAGTGLCVMVLMAPAK